MDALPRARRTLPLLLLVALCLATAGLALAAPGARAGGWTLVSCKNPDGTPAPTDGWTPGVWAGAPVTGSGDVNGCPAGGPLTAIVSGAVPAFTGPEWVFTAPAGDLIAGGTITTSLTAPQGQAWLGTPLPGFDAGDVLTSCSAGGPCGAAGTASGPIAISHPGGTQIFAPAICTAVSAATCPAGGVDAEVDIQAADIELVDSAVPDATDVSGGLLSRPAHGIADLRFTATDPDPAGGSGPGVYAIAVTVDGHSVYAGPPNAKRGTCPSLGSDPTTGGLLFDTAQPCPPTATVSIPVDTATLADGPHSLDVTVTDAGGETATAISNRTITTFNPTISPAPSADSVATRLTVGWDGVSPKVHVHSVSARGLPATGQVSLRCVAPAGARCPRLTRSSAPVLRLGPLWTALKAASFRAGERLQVTIATPARPSERIQYTIQRTGLPVQRLLADGPPLVVHSGRRRRHGGHRPVGLLRAR